MKDELMGRAHPASPTEEDLNREMEGLLGPPLPSEMLGLVKAPIPLPPPTPEPQSPPPPPQDSGPSPADLALAEEGGEIIPTELRPSRPGSIDFGAVAPVIAALPDAPAEARVIDVPGGPQTPDGLPLPPGVSGPPAKSRAQIEYEAFLEASVNVELNILHACYRAVQNFVQFVVRSSPLDSAEIGESMFGPGKRTPIEMAEPQLAIECYRQVRQSMRETKPPSLFSLLAGLVRRILVR